MRTARAGSTGFETTGHSGPRSMPRSGMQCSRHVRDADFPETASRWRGLATEAGFANARELFAVPSKLRPPLLLSSLRASNLNFPSFTTFRRKRAMASDRTDLRHRFRDVVTSEEGLRAIAGQPHRAGAGQGRACRRRPQPALHCSCTVRLHRLGRRRRRSRRFAEGRPRRLRRGDRRGNARRSRPLGRPAVSTPSATFFATPMSG